jgi:hypothetical protein
MDIDELSITLDIGLVLSIFAVAGKYSEKELGVIFQQLDDRLIKQGFSPEKISKVKDPILQLIISLQNGLK